MTSLAHEYQPVFTEDAEYTELHTCYVSGETLDESDLVKDDNCYPARWFKKGLEREYIELMTLELNEDYKL